MKYLLEAGGRAALRALARGNPLLVFDFDGTLAPLVSDPDRAFMRPITRRLLRDVARLHRCAVVSGRARPDLLPRIEDIPLWAVLGNHGAESGRRRAAKTVGRAVRAWKATLERRLGGVRGVWIEDKAFTLTVHYRDALRRSRARGIVTRAARALPGARVVQSHLAINVLPAAAPHKGTAVAGLRRRARCETALYVGDDGSDELVFTPRAGRSLLTVRIGPSRSSRAAFYLRNQAEIDRLLETLLALGRPALRDPGRRRRKDAA